MFKKILLALCIVIAGIVGYAAFQPAEFVIERSHTVNAPAANVFKHINDFHLWKDWSPWAKLDPQAENTFSGADSGVGAVFSWKGNSDVGVGSMTLSESRPVDYLKIDLNFLEPFPATSTTEFYLKESQGTTLVTWKMSGHNNLLSRIMCLFMDMDSMVGGQFALGLQQLQAIVEKSAS